MSGSGIGSWFDPYGNDTDGSTIVAPAPIGSVNGSLGAPGGLFGSGWDAMQENISRNHLSAMNWPDLAAATDPGGDGMRLPPSLYLPQMSDPDSGSMPPAGPYTSGPSFNLYDWLHGFLNKAGPSNTLQFAQDLARSFEDNGNKAEAVGGTGVLIGAATANPSVALGSGGLFALGALANGAGKVLDGGTSFLKSIQQDNNHPLQRFVPRAAEPELPDLEFPDS